jgi:pteridine reductase
MESRGYALVTGAAHRVGRTLALGAAKANYDVIVHYRSSKEQALSVCKEIEQLGKKAIALQADLQNSNEINSLFKKTNEIGKVTALINSAAIFENLTWSNTTVESWERHLKINLTAPFLLSQLFVKNLENQKGVIINISDWKANRPQKDHLPYIVSKGALDTLTASLAHSFAPNVRVNGIALGAILKPSDNNHNPNLLESVPLNRWADLKEVEHTLIYLLNEATYVTGEIIKLDGGRHLV